MHFRTHGNPAPFTPRSFTVSQTRIKPSLPSVYTRGLKWVARLWRATDMIMDGTGRIRLVLKARWGIFGATPVHQIRLFCSVSGFVWSQYWALSFSDCTSVKWCGDDFSIFVPFPSPTGWCQGHFRKTSRSIWGEYHTANWWYFVPAVVIVILVRKHCTHWTTSAQAEGTYYMQPFNEPRWGDHGRCPRLSTIWENCMTSVRTVTWTLLQFPGYRVREFFLECWI